MNVPLQVEYLPSFVQALHQRIDVFFYSIHVKAGACGGRQAEALHERLRTVVAGTDSHARFLIEN